MSLRLRLLVGVIVAAPLLAGGMEGQRPALDEAGAAFLAEAARVEQHGPAGTDLTAAAALARIEAALAAGDLAAANHAWQDANVIARRHRGWPPMIEVGNAALRIGDVAGTRQGFDAKARDAYLIALVRAQRDSSATGIRQVAEAFAALGDTDTAELLQRFSARFDTAPGAVVESRSPSARSVLGAAP